MDLSQIDLKLTGTMCCALLVAGFKKWQRQDEWTPSIRRFMEALISGVGKIHLTVSLPLDLAIPVRTLLVDVLRWPDVDPVSHRKALGHVAHLDAVLDTPVVDRVALLDVDGR